MIYKGFASIYDYLMDDAPYDLWQSYIEEIISTYRNSGKKILDIGCGTGEIAIRLAKQGFEVTGVDLSEEMLAVANAKAAENNVKLFLLEQDMRSLEGFEQAFDTAIICCDSLNYLETEEDIKRTFKAVSDHLVENGLLIFDVHSLYKINHIFANATFTDQDEEVSYIWNSYLADEPNSIEHDLTFFVKEGHLYERYDEVHYQRTFKEEQYVRWLEDANFKVVQINADFSVQSKPNEQSERIFFVAQLR
ncbi:class I SAM-dependent DNA methyltransferase [Metabacillus fastidiosus]|uniref:class I SAM-dependent DNA methyltransferase n=1 Tax=Metabacillus fastidiosus TaxID=1458 RepID=UPI002DB694BC|nr:methyltransferase domain-containing protein [Metabacillus fastidiosus]MEC2076488.1 methyltransferase domain-containing protein [Metabacillus fastidiosus]